MSARIEYYDADGSRHPLVHTIAESAERARFDERASRALHSTASGESMADWGPVYIREARAIMRLNAVPGQLWERVAELGERVPASGPVYLDPDYPPTVMLCGTAGLSAGATVYPVAIDGPAVIVEDTMGREHVVTPGDLAEPPAPCRGTR